MGIVEEPVIVRLAENAGGSLRLPDMLETSIKKMKIPVQLNWAFGDFNDCPRNTRKVTKLFLIGVFNGMRHILPILFFGLFVLRALPAAELLKNGDFETGDTTGWHYWETYPWDGDGVPVESPTHVTIAIPGNIGTPIPPTTSGFFALTQQVSHNGTARGGLYQEVKVVVNTPYILTGYMAFYGDDIGDVTVVGILDGSWNPALAFTTIKKNYMGGNTVSSWMEFSLMIIPSKDVITVFTETRQDWTHGNVAGWYDNLSLRPVPEPTKLLPSQLPKNDSTYIKKQK